MAKNPSFRCSDQFHRNLELAAEALDCDTKSEFIRETLKTEIIAFAPTIINEQDDVDSLTWASQPEGE